jgi:ribonuclease H / adenosylcobalamin/alpha-ribazole phosphatase
MDQLILVRHGETLHNVAGITQGWSDSDLSEKGQRQVRALAERVKRYAPDAIVSSPLGRAMSTAQAIADATGLAIATNEDLREMNYGGWEGKSFLDVRRDYADVFHRWMDDENEACPDGESHADVRRRMERAFASIEAARPIVIAHGTAIRIAATALLNVPVMSSRQFAQDNAAINVFVRRGSRFVLKLWNDTTHCAD